MTDQATYVDEAIEAGVFVEAVDEAAEQVYIPTEAEINAYFIKAFRIMQDGCITGTLELTISARAHNSANTIEVVYSAEGGEWSATERFKSQSLMSSAHNVVARFHTAQACAVKAIPVF
jgi:hypothetical protein